MSVAGIDVGSRRDKTALCGLSGRAVGPLALMPSDIPLAEQAAVLAPLVSDCELVAVDATGLGLGLAEALAMHGVNVMFVTIGAGDRVSRNNGKGLPPFSRVTAGKTWLVQRLGIAIRSRALDVGDSDSARELLRQLGNMTARITQRGRVKMEAPGVAADDLALALALALLAQDAICAHSHINQSSRRSA